MIGVKFSGNLLSMSNVLEKSVYIRQPGNITLSYCRWTNRVALIGIIEVTTLKQKI